MPIRVLIVDDNELDRLNLRLMLSRVSDIVLAGEADDVAGARQLIARTPADALFLDIRLKDQKAFVLKEEIRKIPFVIFTTMYDQYALRAFEVAAFDYLLKPVTEKRLAQTLERLRARVKEAPPPGDAADAAGPPGYILVDLGAQNILLKSEDIAAVLGDRDYTRVIDRRGREFLTRRRMKEWPELLQGRLTALDRSTLVNLDCLESFSRTADAQASTLHLKNHAKPLEIGDTALRRLKELCERGGRAETKDPDEQRSNAER